MDVLRNVRMRGGTTRATTIEYKCMNCREPLEETVNSGLYGRRFCSERCKEQYMKT